MFSRSSQKTLCSKKLFSTSSPTSASVLKLDSKPPRWKRRKVRKSTSKSGPQRCGTASLCRSRVYFCQRIVLWSTTSSNLTKNTILANKASSLSSFNPSRVTSTLFSQANPPLSKQSRNRLSRSWIGQHLSSRLAHPSMSFRMISYVSGKNRR